MKRSPLAVTAVVTPRGGGATPETPPALDPSRRYRVLETVGRGSYGIVLKVHDLELDEVIAVKVLDPRVDSLRARELFKRELKIARRIHHPNVARLHDLVPWQERLAISQEFIDGESLTMTLRRGSLPIERIQALTRCLCSALQAAHDIGVVHRDLKPQNVLIDRRGRPVLVDFGVAVLAGSGAEDHGLIVGTPHYMAPEQVVSPDRVDGRTDVYSLGVLLFEIASGQLPFRGKTPREVLVAHVEKEPPRLRQVRPGSSLALDQVIARCLSKDPGDRYPSAAALHADLEALLAREHRDATPPVAVPPTMRGKVLVIDDDDELRAWIRTVLLANGVVVVEANSGVAGVEKALAEDPDLILLDIVMPELDGRDTLRILKSNPRTRAKPVVMVTGLTAEEEGLFAREAGAASFLTKPIQRDVLELVADRYLSRN